MATAVSDRHGTFVERREGADDEEVEESEEVRALSRALSSRGFFMPAEWEPHSRCWMAWPERRDNWRDGARPAQQAFAEVAAAISEFEPVAVAASTAQWSEARRCLPESVQVLELSSNDAWMRDIGPTFVVREDGTGARQLAAVDWTFNAWGGAEGGVYADWSLDSLLPSKMCEVLGVGRVSTSMVMEGGSFHVDGEGTLLTTASCLLHHNRNPSLTRQGIEARLRAALGVSTFIWLPDGLVGDEDTNGHVDNLACFARPGTVILAWTDDPDHPQARVCREALEVLQRSVDAKGRSLTVIKLPLPPPLYYTKDDLAGLEAPVVRKEGDLITASYVNFYLANGGVVAPAFGIEASDRAAVQVLQAAFPERKVVMVSRARDISLGGGNVHCITQQQPLGLCSPSLE